MKKNFMNSILVEAPKSNYFDLSHDIKFTGVLGDLMPVLCEEVLPGDRFKIGADMMVRCAPMIAPVMHRMDASIHYFFVPTRLLWVNSEKFFSPEDPDEPEPVLPYVMMDDGATAGFQKLADYFGIPPWQTGGQATKINALPFLAYNKVWNDYYRDQNLQNEAFAKAESDGEIDSPFFTVKQRAWEHDYFTAALPWAQKGAPVQIPIDMKASEVKINTNDVNVDGVVLHSTVSGNFTNPLNRGDRPDITDDRLYAEPQENQSLINDLRRATALQRWLEKLARGGSRYIEWLNNVWDTKSSDARLQRAEYITGAKAPIVISEVLNTSGIDGELPQGNMSGHGISVTDGNVGGYFCEEPGYIIGICSITAKPGYMDGIPKMFRKFDRFDFAIPDFAHIGEQEIKKNELLAYTTKGEETFGYIPRYSEYKYHMPYVAGKFRTDISLQTWHLNRKFAWDPDGEVNLNDDFIRMDYLDAARIFATNDPNTEQFYCHLVNKVGVQRKLPLYSNPI